METNDSNRWKSKLTAVHFQQINRKPHHTTVVLLESERLQLKLQSVICGPRQELRAGASQLTVKQTPEHNTSQKPDQRLLNSSEL